MLRKLNVMIETYVYCCDKYYNFFFLGGGGGGGGGAFPYLETFPDLGKYGKSCPILHFSIET